jgi:protein CpxP
MNKSGTYKVENFFGYGMLAIVLVAFASLVAMPITANADCRHDHWDKSKYSEFIKSRQSELHEKLNLSASQEAAWNDFVVKSKPDEQKTRPNWSELSKLSAPDRLDRILAMKKDRLQTMESHIKAVKTFYAQLTPEQKKVFDESFLHPRHGHEWRHKHE